MAIIKVINGKKHVIANSIIKHNQLEDRTDYGCHPIRAIRDLPEKLTQLKDKDAELQSQIDELKAYAQVPQVMSLGLDEDETLNNEIDLKIVETKASNIQLTENNGELTFTNYNGESSSFRSGNEVDDDTIQLVDDKITLKKIYTSDDLAGDGTQTNPISIVNKPDEETLITVDNKFVVQGLKTSSGILTANDIELTKSATQEQLSELNSRLDIADILNANQDDKIHNLEARTLGMGGYLTTYNFGKNPTQDDLTRYAMTDIGVSDPTEIFNGTKVINSYNKHTWVLTNTPDSNPAVFSWQDLGESQYIQYATNKTAGLVKSSTNELEGEIDALGHISINGLEERLADIESKLKQLLNT